MEQRINNQDQLQETIDKLSHRIEQLTLEKQHLEREMEELRILNKQLLEENNQMNGLDFSWTGNLGHWYWNVKTNAVIFNPLKIITLGYTMEELPASVSYQFFTDKVHPDDYPIAMDAMRKHLHGDAPVYEVEYRIQTKSGDYRWYYDRGRITQYDEHGRPLLLAGIVFDTTEKKELLLQLENQNKLLTLRSETDGLTGLSNHRYLMEALSGKIDNFKLTNQVFSVVMFDIDNFKKINDTKGHQYGDMVLADLAAIIRSNVREGDIAGRYGGEEFMIILGNTTLSEAAKIAERIRESVEQHDFEDGIHVTISGGVEEIHLGDQVSDIISSSDRKLYMAKNQGKNKVIS